MDFLGIVDEYEGGLYSDSYTTKSDEDNISIIKRNISPDAQKRILKFKQKRQKYIAEQQDLVTKYNLPYRIQGRDTQVIVYSHEMKSKGSSGGSGSSKPKFDHLDSMNWTDGDFFWVDGAKGIGHVGLIVDTDLWRNHTVIDVMPNGDDNAIQRHSGITKYFNSNGWMEMGAYNCPYIDLFDPYGLHEERNKLVSYAKRRVGYRANYSVMHGKRNQHNTYCSAFVWMAYKYAANLDLDSDGGWVVWPKDLTKSSYVWQFDAQEAK